MVRQLELETVADSTPTLWREATGKGMALFCGSNAIFCNEEGGDSNEFSVVLALVSEQ